MKKIVKMSLAVAMMSGFGAVSAQAADGVSVLSDVKVSGQIRPRFENVDDGNTATKDANAFTARTKLTVNGGLFEVEGLNASVGIISVTNLTVNDFNSGANGHADSANNTAYATVLDPQDAMLSEASISYTTGDTTLHIGRSNINLDNQRFIGTVGWRQLERSYDTVYAANSSIENLSVLAAYVYGYAGVSGVKTTETNSVLLHAAYAVMPELKVTGYGYLLGSIHDTYGVALTGKVDVGTKVSYRAEYAMQSDATMETYGVVAKADASYYNIDLGTNISNVILGINYEAQSGTDGTGTETAFSTPLGTNHGFNGWADQFLSTPTQGLNDLNVRIGYKTKDFGKLLVKYHVFTSDKDMSKQVGTGTTTDLGSEIDVVYVNAIPGVKDLKGLIKYASFSAGDSSVKTNDVSKLWVGVDYKF